MKKIRLALLAVAALGLSVLYSCGGAEGEKGKENKDSLNAKQGTEVVEQVKDSAAAAVKDSTAATEAVKKEEGKQ